MSSCVFVPLEARGRVLGTLRLVSTDHRRLRFGEADLAGALDLGRRAGMAIDNARLYTDQQRQGRLLGGDHGVVDVVDVVDVVERQVGASPDAGDDRAPSPPASLR